MANQKIQVEDFKGNLKFLTLYSYSLGIPIMCRSVGTCQTFQDVNGEYGCEGLQRAYV